MGLAQPNNKSSIGEASDEDLVVYMAAGDEEERRRAWYEFYRRHRNYLLFVIQGTYGGYLDRQGVEDLVHDTFVSAFEGAHTFKAGGLNEPDRLRRHVRAWLAGIARNLFRDMLRDERLPSEHFEEWETVPNPDEISESSNQQPSRYQQLLNEAFETVLTERERLILLLTADYYRPGEEHHRLPNDVSAELARMFSTKPVNIRQIRKRAIDKVIKYVFERLETPQNLKSL